MDDEKLMILQMLRDGKIDPSEADQLLAALEEVWVPGEAAEEGQAAPGAFGAEPALTVAEATAEPPAMLGHKLAHAFEKVPYRVSQKVEQKIRQKTEKVLSKIERIEHRYKDKAGGSETMDALAALRSYVKNFVNGLPYGEQKSK